MCHPCQLRCIHLEIKTTDKSDIKKILLKSIYSGTYISEIDAGWTGNEQRYIDGWWNANNGNETEKKKGIKRQLDVNECIWIRSTAIKYCQMLFWKIHLKMKHKNHIQHMKHLRSICCMSWGNKYMFTAWKNMNTLTKAVSQIGITYSAPESVLWKLN